MSAQTQKDMNKRALLEQKKTSVFIGRWRR